MNIVALAGGVGGAKLVDGLAQVIHPEEFTIIVNTGDDFTPFGITVCPDLDTVCYTLAGLANPDTGWGRSGETWQVYESLAALEGPTWFHLGDRDLATHLERTRRLLAGETLSQVTREFCQVWKIRQSVLPMTDDRVKTIVHTRELGDLPFQEYFVKLRCQPTVSGFHFEGIANARTAPGVLEALERAELVVICPSNPWVSIGPILALPDVLDLLHRKTVIAVSPLIGGQAVKGPAAKMYQELGIRPSARAVAEHYRHFLKGFILDRVDQVERNEIEQWGIIPNVTNILMSDQPDRKRLAQEVLAFGQDIGRIAT